jgi:hypothetical protein
LFTTSLVHKTERLTVMCAVVRLHALMARQAAQLFTYPPIAVLENMPPDAGLQKRAIFSKLFLGLSGTED